MEMMRHNDSRLTDKTYTDASQLLTAAAVGVLPSLIAKYTVKDTQISVFSGLGVSNSVACGLGFKVQKTSVNIEESQLLSFPVTMGQEVDSGCLARTRT